MRETRRSRQRHSERGASIAELAVAIPILFLIMLGAVDFGRVWSEGLALSNAVRAGAQWGSESTEAVKDFEGIKRSVLDDLEGTIDPSEIASIAVTRFCECSDGSSVDCDDRCGLVQPRTYVQVRIDKKFETLFRYPGIPKEVNLVRQARCRAS
jgi:Flp pilus assembly protein TadG